jgi:SAM-dependent methyltransferase
MKTNEEWRLWGKRDPLFGVASWRGRQRGGDRPWTDEEFYALGDDWLDFHDHWQRYGMLASSVIEIGCGAGRITNHLARSFSKVVGSDVSEDMIAYARRRVTAPNIEWRVSDGLRLPAADSSIDAVFSCQVFQHFPNNKVQLLVFREIYRVLRPGGSFIVHLPMHSYPGLSCAFKAWNAASYAAYKALFNARALLWRAAMHFGARPYMNSISYEIGALHRDLRNLGFQRVEFMTFPVRTNGALHPCVLGTKA